MDRCSALRALFPGALLLLSLAAMTGECQAPDSTAPAAAPTGDAAGSPTLPLWAFPVAPPRRQTAAAPSPQPATAANATPRHVPGSSQSYTSMNHFMVPDWFPNEHPPMPAAVREGRKPDVYACGYCHLPNGLGRPENSSVAGLPKAYIIEQVKDFQDGSRRGSEPRMASVHDMIVVAKAATADEVEQAAEYFSQLKLTKWIRVVETDMVPRTHIVGGMLVAEAEGTEPIGSRIIEVSEDYEQTELRNPRSGFIAYVPKGSLKAGEALVKTGGNGKTIACTTCHGANLLGVGDIPGIAGRSPSQMARQLIDFRDGARNGPLAALMKLPVAKLTDDDIVAITAYLASLEP